MKSEAFISNNKESKPEIYQSYGSIEGYLLSLSLDDKSNIEIHSLTDQKVIPCYFPDNLFEQGKKTIGKKVYVFGIIRQYLHGDKIDIKVQELELLPQPSQASNLDNILKRIRGETIDS